jgi:5-formyltetrahydrofolate cyclo-ligase
LNHPGTKQEIRERLRALRQGLTPAEVAEGSLAVARRVLAAPEAKRSRVVCLYAAAPGEVQTGLLLAEFLAAGKTVAVPDWEGWRKGSGLRLLAVAGPRDLLCEGRAVPQPRFSPGALVPVERVDLFLVPGLAFTPRGERLGMGGGFYDRLLLQASPDAAVFGLAFDFQLLDQLPVEPHDVPVHHVIVPCPGPAVSLERRVDP